MVSPNGTTLEQRLQPARVGEEPPSPASAMKTTTPLAPKCVRKNLLYKLGFENRAPPGSVPSNREPSRGSLLGQVQTRTERLKYDEDFERYHLEKKEREMQRSSNSNASPPTDNLLAVLGSIFTQQSLSDREDELKPCKAQSVTSVESNTILSSSSDETSTSSKKGRNRLLSFNDEVTVVPIPKKEEYSKRIRGRLWVNAQELQSQVARNTVEFAHEGWDWKKAYEDEHMYVCAVTGEKVHPVHVDE
jgi:hypothetical protein